ncbi:MAG: tetratricopeptide repeat protein [Proteobacteria bacterium]|nr:tetratricopeptide repeat protein [Pseudomonadota bacterium]
MNWRSRLRACILALCPLGLLGTAGAQTGAADVDALNARVVELYAQGHYDQALAVAREALAQAEATFGPRGAEASTSLGNLAGVYQALGRYDAAQPLLERALALREQALGPEHPDTLRTLHNLAGLHYALGQYAQALRLYQRVLTARERSLGPEHPDVAVTLNNLAAVHDALGQYALALPLYQRALALREQAFGPEHPGVASSLNNLAALLDSMGRYHEALPLYQRALALQDKLSGPEHPLTLSTLNNLGLLYRNLGRYDEALPLLQRALALREQVLGPEHPDTATSLNNLAELYGALGRYDEALPLYRRTLAISEQTLGPQHPGTAVALNNLADALGAMGQYGAVLPLYQRALAIREQALGPQHPDTASSLNNLAWLQRTMGRFDEALPLLQRALALREQALGPQHPDTASSLNNLADLFDAMGRHDAALPLYQRALAIREKTLGPQHPLTAASLSNLASCHASLGEDDQALTLQQRALALREQTLGPAHPDTATSLNNLAWLHGRAGRWDEALPLLRRAVLVLSAADANAPADAGGARLELAIASGNLAYALQQQGPAASDEAIYYYKLSVSTRQHLRAGTAGLDAATRASFTGTVAGAYRALSGLLIAHGRIAEAERVLLLLQEAQLSDYLRRNGGSGAQPQALAWTPEEAALRRDLDDIAARWGDYERQRRELLRRAREGAPAEDLARERERLDQRRLQLRSQTENVLQDASARFAGASLEASQRRQQSLQSARTGLSALLAALGREGPRTAGLLLLPDEHALTLIVVTDQGAVPLLRPVAQAEIDTQVAQLRHSIQQRQDYRPAARALYDQLIAPAEAQLAGQEIAQWVMLPFGNLGALPFAALLAPDGRHLVERYALALLTADGSGGLQGLDTPSRTRWHGAALGASQADAEFGSIPLQGVRSEVCGVIRAADDSGCPQATGVMAGQRYLDRSFTRALLQRQLGPLGDEVDFLHIATHYQAQPSRLLLGDGSKVSAQELLGWEPQLSRYDLITLSACDSGSGSGALQSLGGMLRSHGARAVLATLWPVADIGAAPLMVEFYRQRGETRAMGKAEALRQAQRAMIGGRLRDESGQADLRQPYFWAPYVLMGNWL